MKKRLHWSRVQRANTTRVQDGELKGTAARADPGHGAGGLDINEVKDHDVYPAMIVHRRSGPRAENDLLVI